MEDLVSIITPAHNAEKFISQTIQSVLKQSYFNWEMIIVDDFSSDKTTDIVDSFILKDKRIKLIKLEKNSGAGEARNTAIEFTKGKYIAFLDSDDLWKTDKLEKQLVFMAKNNLPFTFSFYECIDEEGNLLNKIVEAPKKLTYQQLFFCNYIGNLTAIYNVEELGKIPISSIRKRQDWMLWLTILKKIKIAQPVPESLAFYRVRKNSISSSKIKLLKHNFNVYRKFHKHNFLISLVNLLKFLVVHFIVKPKYTKTT